MTSIRTRALLILVLATALAACMPSASSSPSSPPSANPSSEPSTQPSTGAACPVVEQSGVLPSDNVTEIKVETTPTADLVTFVLGPETSAPTSPTGKISAATPPFSSGGSGEPVEVPGTHFVEIRLEGIMNSDDAGNPTYTGELRFEPTFPALQALVNVDAFEGHFTWIAGYDGLGCVTLLPNAPAGTFIVSFGH
jgi:hypothetical protein